MNEAILYSSVTGFSTFIGSILVYLFPMTRRLVTFALGLSMSVMLWAAYLTLLPAAMEQGSFLHLLIGMGFGMIVMGLLHTVHGKRVDDQLVRLGFYLFFAMVIHNAPEGAAIGIGFGAEAEIGMILSLAMLIHNVPEGIGMAAPFVAAGRPPWLVLGLALISGAVFPLGTWFGLTFKGSADIISIGLIFSATVMCWIAVEIGKKAFADRPIHAWQGILVGILFMYIVHLFHG